MSSYTQEITKAFSRLKNGLLENQAWWPVTITNDGSLGLTVDTTLFASEFGPHTPSDEGRVDTESNTPGIRLEYLTTTTEKDRLVARTSANPCTVQMAGSGTPEARLIFTWPDSTTTTLYLMAASEAQYSEAEIRTQSSGGYSNTTGLVRGRQWINGPFPVYMTLQELADILDTWQGTDLTVDPNFTDNPSGKDFNPHGAVDPLTNWLGTETGAAVACTVFMPMLLDMNQFGKASSHTHEYTNTVLTDGYTPKPYATSQYQRFDPDPEGADTANFVYKVANHSGDHKARKHSLGDFRGGVETAAYVTGCDHGMAANPKYRMRMALAVFLRDGTYTLDDGGVIIPYSYDASRTEDQYKMSADSSTPSDLWGGLGGQHFEQMFKEWNGGGADGKSPGYAEENFDGNDLRTQAGIWPGCGFVQGPLSANMHGNNGDFWMVNWFMYFDSLGWDATWTDPLSFNYQALYNQSMGFHWGIPTNTRSLRIVQVTIESVPVYNPSGPNTDGAIRFWYNDTETWAADSTGAENRCLWVKGMTGTFGGELDAGSYDLNGWHKITEEGEDAATYPGMRYIEVRNGWWERAITGDPDNPGPLPAVIPVTTGVMYQGYQLPDDTIPYAYGAGSAGMYGTPLWAFNPQWIATGGNWGADDASREFFTHHPYLASTEITLVGYPDTDTTSSRHPSGLKRFRGSANGSMWQSPTRSVAGLGGGALSVPPNYHPEWRNLGSSTQSSTYGQRFLQWASQGVQTFLWSAIDPETGRHAWDYIKPKSPQAGGVGTLWAGGRNRPWPGMKRAGTTANATTAYKGAVAPTDSAWDRGILADAITGEQRHTDRYGLHEWGASPIHLDLELTFYASGDAGKMFQVNFEDGRTNLFPFGYRSNIFNDMGWARQNMPVAKKSQIRAPNYAGPFTGVGIPFGGIFGHYPYQDQSAVIRTDYGVRYGPARPAGRPFFWLGQSDMMTAGNESDWTTTYMPGTAKLVDYTAGNTGFGHTENRIGFAQWKSKGGFHDLRVMFTNGGMSCVFNGTNYGTDAGAVGPIFGVSFDNAMAWRGAGSGITQGIDDFENGSTDNALIDSVKMRQIPTDVMLPFKAETETIGGVNASNTIDLTAAAKVRSLRIHADGISVSEGRYITVSICDPATPLASGEGQPAGTPVNAAHTNMTVEVIGGYGDVDLSNLPASNLTNGFTVRFEFWIPTTDTATAQTLDWSNLPTIRKWEILYDLQPTATSTVIQETYAGDTTPPIDTKVGHVVSYRASTTTTDPDRLMTHIKFDFGDGTVTDWFAAETPATTITRDITHIYDTSGAGLSMIAYGKDDNGNIATASTITVNVATAEPVATLRVSPTLIRAGQAVNIDASESFDPDKNGSIASYTFGFGDGSSAITSATATTTHTYAQAGEYVLTLTCTDNTGVTSSTTTSKVKVLPATATVDLTLNTQPASFERAQVATITQTQIIDSVYPELSDIGQRSDEFRLSGLFLKETAEQDIDYMESLLAAGSLIRFEWQSVNFSGVADSRYFVGRIVSFDYSREGGQHGQTPWSATLIREAGQGA